MTYKVSSGTLSLYSLTPPGNVVLAIRVLSLVRDSQSPPLILGVVPFAVDSRHRRYGPRRLKVIGRDSESTLSTQRWFIELALPTNFFTLFLKEKSPKLILSNSTLKLFFCPYLTVDCSTLKKFYYVI